MTSARRERLQVSRPLLLLSALAWVLLAAEPNIIRMPAHSVAMPMPMPPVSFTSLALGWQLMLTAMMLPLLIAPVRHLRDRSFTHRRARRHRPLPDILWSDMDGSRSFSCWRSRCLFDTSFPDRGCRLR